MMSENCGKRVTMHARLVYTTMQGHASDSYLRRRRGNNTRSTRSNNLEVISFTALSFSHWRDRKEDESTLNNVKHEQYFIIQLGIRQILIYFKRT